MTSLALLSILLLWLRCDSDYSLDKYVWFHNTLSALIYHRYFLELQRWIKLYEMQILYLTDNYGDLREGLSPPANYFDKKIL